MARLYLFAEGQTEQTFATDVLGPRLSDFGVYLRAIPIAHAKKKGIPHRGGGSKYIPMRDDIRNLLGQEKGRDVFFTTMIDLYAISTKSPGWEEAEKLRHLPYKRVEVLEQAFADDVGDPRFIPYIQLHEYEAYLFSDPAQFGFFYKHREKAIVALQAIADGKTTPELIDADSAPSKRIEAVLPDYKSAKCVVGPQVAERIGLDVIRGKCPHFAAWLSRLEQLGVGPH